MWTFAYCNRCTNQCIALQYMHFHFYFPLFYQAIVSWLRIQFNGFRSNWKQMIWFEVFVTAPHESVCRVRNGQIDRKTIRSNGEYVISVVFRRVHFDIKGIPLCDFCVSFWFHMHKHTIARSLAIMFAILSNRSACGSIDVINGSASKHMLQMIN